MTSFSIGPLVPLEGGDGEAVTAWGSRIATLGASRATVWLEDERPFTVELPDVPVGGACWSADGMAVLAGTGRVDVERRSWLTSDAVAGLVVPGPPGYGAFEIQATSWSADARHVAVLLAWSGPTPSDGPERSARVVVVDTLGSAGQVEIPADSASGVLVAGDRVVVAAPTVQAFTLGGDTIGTLAVTPGSPHRISGGEGPIFLFDPDRSIRVVDPDSWTVRAVWRGPRFVDAVAVPGGLVGLDAEGTLHAATVEADGLEEIGSVDTRRGLTRLAVTGDGRLVLIGAGSVGVHTATFYLTPG